MEVLDGFPDDQNGDHDECDGVNKRGQCREPQPAEGVSYCWGAMGKPDGQQRKKERCGISEHMPGIGQQGQ